ncbi:multifunctional CCA tRNA nucleotidyl transferase/2'3'-cyclic phosphodiesterase/2'nucleotidase/phosphatase [Marinobacter panjinensis]|uniref:CCA-adding enzyme n=1 Tax=Marinobacter panjinensis TaxID=2576384 RepID=A0A4U6R3X6_9GAMM|nr:multifunctional CCA tRNA nucleotidyl transferase/2'3'-cyclic phosphodiesterase/2'nucleotidase/phosphatase [Marinobacter panjinensis]MCR8916289.1 multifunctional CCA tRNA nucleotidyl transferase/2'3'-cyclic phosphodiesterase/2'nucleotidase/phosphatase [Marinobacter panjinensis]TKV68249.1 multifunctional CCA tRNA nucleotidyl transferase/2'3'-cyclic phosphodiesterase/2'nucleotidase/phosphatase [Marinobacter panjinensis]
MKTYLVGGAVRDELLGLPVKDRDWVVTGATPDEMLQQGFKQVGADFPVFLHPDTREEYALARTERKQGRGYHGFTVYSAPDVTLEEDLRRRDLTINAMAKTTEGELVDPFGGREDVQARSLRHVSEAFAEDPLRILRTARFAARLQPLGFTVAEPTMALMRQMVKNGEVEHLVPERVWQEIQRALHENEPGTFFEVLRDCGALATIVPELDRDDALSVALSALRCVHNSEAETSPRFAALMSSLTPDEARNRAAQLKAPNDCQDLARLTTSLLPQIRAMTSYRAESLLEVLDEADVWRRADRFAELLQTLNCALPDTEQKKLGWLESAQHAATGVQAKDLMAQGYRGKDLGRAIRNERLRRISEL